MLRVIFAATVTKIIFSFTTMTATFSQAHVCCFNYSIFDAPCFNFLTTDAFLPYEKNTAKDKVTFVKKITKILVVII